MNFDRLRFVAERAEVGEEREALFAVTIPEERGSFRRFCELIGAARGHRVQLPHRGRDEAHVFVGVAVDAPRTKAATLAATFREPRLRRRST